MLCHAVDTQALTAHNQQVFDMLSQAAANLDAVMKDLNTILTTKEKRVLLYEELLIQNVYINVLNKLSPVYQPFKRFVSSDFKGMPAFSSVRSHIETILLHLLSNSIRFRRLDTELDIRVSATATSDRIELTVKDNGLGLDLNKFGHDVFRIYKTFQPGTSGKGLGLYLCKLLVNDLDGKIDLRSKPKEGMEVVISLPFKSA